jgi:O-antigen/teichoic acid export membrane protein
MAVIAVFTFAYEMVDRWLLQRYGGASQQGFYQVAAQLSTISLLATSSMLNIFWKEIAEANERGAHERVAGMYRKTTQSLIFVAAFVTCFLVPWSETLVDTLLGSAFHSAWPVLALMLFYPIHQTVGQINGTLFMATGSNSVYMKLTVIGLIVSIPVSYVMIGPSTGWAEIGMAVKIVGLNFIFVNIQSWVIVRHYGVSFEWIEPLVAILVLLLIGFACEFMVGQLHSLVQPTIEESGLWSMLTRMGVAGVLYLSAGLVLVTQVPSLAGMQRDEVRRYWAKFGDLFRQRKG